MFRDFFTQRLKRGLVRRFNNRKIAGVAGQVARRSPEPAGPPIVFFKASTGIDDLSWTSGFHLLASWALRLRGIPVVYFACQAGMSKCVLGTNRDHPQDAMPCKSCIYQSETLYTGVPAFHFPSPDSRTYWFTFDRDRGLELALQNLNLEQLSNFEWTLGREAVIAGSANSPTPAPARHAQGRVQAKPSQAENQSLPVGNSIPLGALCLPGLRWILRLHHLHDDEPTRHLLREYILSAWNIARRFARLLDETQPRAVVVFNGQFFPEATARYVARLRGLRVITHEVGLQPASAFFTDGEATAYPIHIPDEFELDTGQNARLDAYLARRFQGDFTMAGIRFWPDMHGLSPDFLRKAAGFKQIVPVFTNVIFDTSQPHANTVFADMFAWLDLSLEVMRRHPETLFVIRAHPDELRVRKSSRETVAGWVEASGAANLPNVVFVASNEPLSSYDLIQRSKFVMVYNSTIGLEAAILGAAVLCAGRARFTQYPTVFFPQSVEELRTKMEQFLAAEKIEVPPGFRRNARRFLYYQLFRTSLPFDPFLEPSVRTTQTKLKSFGLEELLPESSKAIEAIFDGLLKDGDFLLEEK